jgi:hypothetical protein
MAWRVKSWIHLWAFWLEQKPSYWQRMKQAHLSLNFNRYAYQIFGSFFLSSWTNLNSRLQQYQAGACMDRDFNYSVQLCQIYHCKPNLNLNNSWCSPLLFPNWICLKCSIPTINKISMIQLMQTQYLSIYSTQTSSFRARSGFFSTCRYVSREKPILWERIYFFSTHGGSEWVTSRNGPKNGLKLFLFYQ